MVYRPRCTALVVLPLAGGVACVMAALALGWLGVASPAAAQQPGVHYLHQGVMPPGAIGGRQLQRGGPLPGYFQPVEIKAPQGALVSLAVAGTFDGPKPAPRRTGFLIGQVYRMRVTNIHLHPGMEVFPTIEVTDRLYPPRGQETRFAIPIELTQEDLELALQGKFVTRVIYLEDPRRALPVAEDPQRQEWFEIGPGRDPLAAADALGRPVAILRMGARLPDAQGPDMQFLFGCPPFIEFPPRRVPPAGPSPDEAPPAEGQPAAGPPAFGPGGAVPVPPEANQP